MNRILAFFISVVMVLSLCACGAKKVQEYTYDKTYIEETLNLANNANQEWSYDAKADAWVLSVVSAVAYPELPDQQGASVCVPGVYVKGIDTNGDGTADATSGTVKGSLVIDYGQEDYVFGSRDRDARHWIKYLLEILILIKKI